MNAWILSIGCYLFAMQGMMIPQENLSSHEAFFLRRVTEFWKDRDYPLVKKQIEEFLSSHESSNIHNNLYALMGDMLYQESDYAGALASYNKITDPLLIEKIQPRRFQCLYLVEDYDEVTDTLASLFQDANKKVEHLDEMKFIFADSLFRKMRGAAEVGGRQELASQAKPFFLELFNTSYQDKVLLPLAEIHRELGELKEACPLYQMLAEKRPGQREEFLLQAAVLQLQFDPLIALETFQQVVDLGGVRASDAAYQELLLLFQNDRFSDLISRAPKLEMHLSSDQRAMVEFCLARSYFKLEQLPEATVHFRTFVQQELDNTPYKRAAFLNLIYCAQKTENGSLFDEVLEQFLAAFPRDEEAGKVLLLHAQTALQKGDATQASRDLNQLLKDFPDFPDQETLLYDQALLLSKTEQWSESRNAFIAYLKRFPSTPHSNLIWSAVVHSSIQALKRAAEDQISEKKELLASDLAQALTICDLFSPEEEASYQFLLGQLMFDLHHFKEAAIELDRLCQKYPNHASLSEAYLLQALAHRELKSEPQLFISVAEKALALSENPTHKSTLRLYLFNAYLATKEYDKAADNLYQTFLVDGNSIQQENQLWLINHYLEKAQKGDLSSKERTQRLFKKVLVLDEQYGVHFDPSHTALEAEALKFAGILAPQEKERLLRSLIELQAAHESYPWKLQDHILFELAKTSLSLHQTDEALKGFDELISKERLTSSMIGSAALLEKSRLLLSRADFTEKNEENSTLRFVLSTLKDLQVQKQLAHEPIHLEAALDYADLRISLAPEELRAESALFFLNRIKEDFYAKDDPTGHEYHEARLRYPEKDQLFQSYMKYLEAEIFSWESIEALRNNDVEKEAQAKKVAISLFKEILQDVQATPYLKHRAALKLDTLR